MYYSSIFLQWSISIFLQTSNTAAQYICLTSLDRFSTTTPELAFLLAGSPLVTNAPQIIRTSYQAVLSSSSTASRSNSSSSTSSTHQFPVLDSPSLREYLLLYASLVFSGFTIPHVDEIQSFMKSILHFDLYTPPTFSSSAEAKNWKSLIDAVNAAFDSTFQYSPIYPSLTPKEFEEKLEREIRISSDPQFHQRLQKQLTHPPLSSSVENTKENPPKSKETPTNKKKDVPDEKQKKEEGIREKAQPTFGIDVTKLTPAQLPSDFCIIENQNKSIPVLN